MTELDQSGQEAGDTPQGAADDSHSDTSMERVRNLLFGSQMREQERKVGELNERVRKELDRLAAEQAQRLDKLDEAMRKELQRMHLAINQERQTRIAAFQELGEKLAEVGRELDERIHALDERLGGDMLDVRGELRDAAREHQQALKTIERELTDAMTGDRDRLDDEKTSRDELAQLFTELGLRLKREFELPDA